MSLVIALFPTTVCALALPFLASAPLSEDFPPVAPGSVSPEIAGASDGVLWLSWVEREGDAASVRVARKSGTTWSDPVVVARGAEILVNDADIPQVVPLADGSVMVQWLARVPGGTQMKVARSKDGRTFAAPVALGSASAAERGFARFFTAGGKVRAVWLDDGKLVSAAWEGKGFGPAETVDERVCECCQLAVAETGGAAVVAYRDRSEEEVRDIAIVRFADGAWGKPIALADDGWKIPACPVNGPALDARGDAVVASWFTGAGDEGKVRVAFSKDGGRSFGEPVRVDGGRPQGKVAARWIDDAHALVTWIERDDEGNSLHASWVKTDGTAGEPEMVAAFRSGKSDSHPRLARVSAKGKKDELHIAWSDGRGDTRKPHLVRVAQLGRPDLSRVRNRRDAQLAEDTAAAVDALLKHKKGPAGVRVGDAAPEIDGIDIDGKPVKLSDYRGNVVLVSFWGSWCPPCREEIPEHVDMRETLRQKGFEILSVNSGDTPKVAREFAKEHGMAYPIVVDDGISQRWRVAGFPTNVVVDRAGKIRGRTQGYSPKSLAEQRRLVEELLAEPAP